MNKENDIITTVVMPVGISLRARLVTMVIVTTAVVVAFAAIAAWLASARIQRLAAEKVLHENVNAIMPEMSLRAWRAHRDGRQLTELVPPSFENNSPLPRAIINRENKILTSSESPAFQEDWVNKLSPINGHIQHVELPNIGYALALSTDIDLRIPPKRPTPPERMREDARDLAPGPRRLLDRFDERSEQFAETLAKTKPRLVLIHPLESMHRELTNQAWLLGGMWFLACAAVAGVALFITSRVLKPVHTLTEAIAAIEPGTPHHHIAVPHIAAELHPVQTRLNELMDRVNTVLRREQQTTANIAHELRTPLTGLRTQLELALSRERDPAEIAELCRQGLSTMTMLQGLVDNLLLLSRLEAGKERPNATAVEFAEVLASAWSLHQPTAVARKVTLDRKIEPALSLVTDGDKLRAILSNLLSNGVTYATPNSHILVTAHEQGDSRIRISVSNPGATISAADAERVFETFWRGDSARTVEKGHCGLGLPLVRRLVHVLGGTVTAHVKDALFTILILLPADVRKTDVDSKPVLYVP